VRASRRARAAQQASRSPAARSVLKVGATTSAKTIAVRGSAECAAWARSLILGRLC
jgi:hypothetical protein